MRKPNILWIMTDQQSANMMSCCGNKDLHTPNMDYLAKQGIRFEHAYCANPVCLPSRFSLITGMYPGDIGLRSNEYKNEVKELPSVILENGLGRLLKKAGYEPVYGGKEHFPYMNAKQLGFDYICSDEREQLAEVCAEYINKYDKKQPFAMVASFINPHDICLMAISDFAESSETGEEKLLLEYFKDAMDSVHKAAQIPDGMHEDVFYECICPELPKNYQISKDEPEAIAIMQKQRRFKEQARKYYTKNQWRMHRYAYARLTEEVDRQIGKLVNALKTSGKWEDTVIIFTSDHGDMDASHKMEHKTALYQECCQVPLIIKGIEGEKENVSDFLTSNGLDIICTVLDYAGVRKPKYLSGISLKDIVETGIVAHDRKGVVVESEFGIMVVDQQYKYVRYRVGARCEQFYDLTTNPGEQYNQIEEPCYLEKILEMKKIVENHLTGRGGFGSCVSK